MERVGHSNEGLDHVVGEGEGEGVVDVGGGESGRYGGQGLGVAKCGVMYPSICTYSLISSYLVHNCNYNPQHAVSRE